MQVRTVSKHQMELLREAVHDVSPHCRYLISKSLTSSVLACIYMLCLLTC